MKGEEGVLAPPPPPPPLEDNGMKRSQIKWKLLLFDEKLRPVYFLFSFNIAMLFNLSQSRNMYSF